jgi:FtsP/CotA-like multicopper oxidase with cupredoxin domain
LAGLWIIEDEQKKQLFEVAGLGDILLSARDVPLAFSDKTFSHDVNASEARLVFPYGSSDANGLGVPAFSILPEMFGYTMTVNGR